MSGEREIRDDLKAVREAARDASDAVRALQARRPAGVEDEMAQLFDAMLRMQSGLVDLQDGIARMQERAGEGARRAIDRDAYGRTKVGNGWAYVPKGESEPLLCPSCFSAGSLSYLVLEPHSLYDPTKLLNCQKCGVSIRPGA